MSVTEVHGAPRWKPVALWTVTVLRGIAFAERSRLQAAIVSR
jgi:hypothetical protein